MRGMTSKAEEYQVKARECEQRAEEATRGLQRQVYAEFARQWREVAEQVKTRTPSEIDSFSWRSVAPKDHPNRVGLDKPK